MAVPRPLINLISNTSRSWTWTCISCLVRTRLEPDGPRTTRRRISSSARDPDLRGRASNDSSNSSTGQALPRQQLRSFHGSSQTSHKPVDHHRQAVPLGDFYTELLSSPLPKGSEADTTSLPEWVPKGDKTREERAKQIFGALRGSGYERRLPEIPESKWRTINGVPVPPRPLEPDNCCMSGCVHCVWDDYRDDLEEWAARVKEAQAKAQKKSTLSEPKIQVNRPEVHAASSSMDDDGGGSEGLWTTPSSRSSASSSSTPIIDEDLIFEGIPVGIREFMNTEKKIRERKRARREKGLNVDDY
ncbi:hypothetical protein HRR83_004684 [Exophiala dermatitidis]|uniref:Oxidoreductase-like domain-containing protein n=2 Tax=Exophiala dermatitidis TaxID=5970 RepID=H6BRT6_EXODN|nr:uncharacterized protein HMPREF1120_02215 [Exophiala dermatitidis NIH/UT8656]KAJ4515615.1 hypothetical protein HRR75_003694 [Exophiala dermatitidis]EHY54038.1 hypothetical protein HMPREF1120_02215 [Exophiala dermatitidis NIH/UT8656]KAJ4519293.1 hypothetical protein HRR74_004034 [Exophiala dermatitidis]KAJ4529109.1 hypothetical protein HRR73_000129 [Exophiala dermatitidis]KAJ4538509.1 hypothetical protein HRR77_006992 [Exophiala dermatitidis]